MLTTKRHIYIQQLVYNPTEYKKNLNFTHGLGTAHVTFNTDYKNNNFILLNYNLKHKNKFKPICFLGLSNFQVSNIRHSDYSMKLQLVIVRCYVPTNMLFYMGCLTIQTKSIVIRFITEQKYSWIIVTCKNLMKTTEQVWNVNHNKMLTYSLMVSLFVEPTAPNMCGKHSYKAKRSGL